MPFSQQYLNNMKFLWLIVSGVLICIVLQLLLPWFVFAGVTFFMFFFIPVNKLYKAFLSGVLIVSIAWILLYMWFDIQNAGLLSTRMAEVFGLSNKNLFLLISSLLMGIIGGFSACAGYALRWIRK